MHLYYSSCTSTVLPKLSLSLFNKVLCNAIHKHSYISSIMGEQGNLVGINTLSRALWNWKDKAIEYIVCLKPYTALFVRIRKTYWVSNGYLKLMNTTGHINTPMSPVHSCTTSLTRTSTNLQSSSQTPEPSYLFNPQQNGDVQDMCPHHKSDVATYERR